MTICGIITEPIDAVSATDEPEMQPNSVLGEDVDQREPAADEADEHLGEVDQARRHAALGHDRAGEHEERDRQQREVVGAVGDLEHHRLERDVDPQRGDERGEAERIGDRHAERAQQRERAEQDEDVHGYSSSAAWSLYMNDVGGGSPIHTRSIRNSSVSRPAIGIGR